MAPRPKLNGWVALLALVSACGSHRLRDAPGAPRGAGGDDRASYAGVDAGGAAVKPACGSDGGPRCLVDAGAPEAPPAACTPTSAQGVIPPVCDGHWCDEHAPLAGVETVLALAADDVFFGLERFHGGVVALPPIDGLSDGETVSPLVGLSGTASDDVWATTTSLALHFDGCRWTRDARVTSAGPVFALSREDVWIASPGVVRHFDGRDWTSEPVPMFTPTAIHAAAPDRPWIVGNQDAANQLTTAVVLHRTAKGWSFASLPEANRMTAVWSFADDDTWLAGPNHLWHWDGQVFVRDGTPCSITSFSSPGDRRLWAGCAFEPRVVRFDGQWTSIPVLGYDGRFPTQIEARADDDVWVVGEERIVHVDGTATATPRFGLDGRFTDVAVVPGGDGGVAYALGGTLTRRDPDGSWKSIALPGDAGPVTRVGASSESDVWALTDKAAFRFDGAAWTRHDLAAPEPAELCSVGPFEAYAFGKSGAVERWDGFSWSADGQVDATNEHLSCLGSGDVWIAGPGGVHHRRAGRWERLAPVPAPSTLFARRADDVWMRTTEGTYRFDGNEWRRGPATTGPLDPGFTALALTPTGTAWELLRENVTAPGSTGMHLRRFDQTADSFLDVLDIQGTDRTGGPPERLFAFSDQSIMLGSQSERLDLFDGGSLSTLAPGDPGPSPSHSDAPMWFDAPTSGWAWDRNAQVMRRYAGGQWSADPTFPLKNGVTSLWGSGPKDLWAGGTGIAHFDGSAWTALDTSLVVTWVHGAAAGDVWFGTATGLLHYWKQRLEVVPVPPAATLVSAAGDGVSATSFWIAATPMLLWDGSALTPYRTLDAPRGLGLVSGQVHALDANGQDWVRGATAWRSSGLPAVSLPMGSSTKTILTGTRAGFLRIDNNVYSFDSSGARLDLSLADPIALDSDGRLTLVVGRRGRILRRAP